MQEWDLSCQLCAQTDGLKGRGSMKVLYSNIAEELNQHGMLTGKLSSPHGGFYLQERTVLFSWI